MCRTVHATIRRSGLVTTEWLGERNRRQLPEPWETLRFALIQPIASEFNAGVKMTWRLHCERKSSLSIVRMLSRLSRCAPKPPRASVGRRLRPGEKQHRRHRQRHRAHPVQVHRRHFFAAAGIGLARRASSRQHSRKSARREPLARGDAEQHLHRKMRAHAFAARRQRARASRRARLAARARRDRCRRDTRSSARPAADCSRSSSGVGLALRHRDSRSTARHARRAARPICSSIARTSGRLTLSLIASPPPTPSAILPIGMEADQFAAAKYRLRLLGRAGDQLLHQHLVGKGIRRDKLTHGLVELARIAHEPDAAARGADRGLDHGGKAHRRAQLAFRRHDRRRRLRQSQFAQAIG